MVQERLRLRSQVERTELMLINKKEQMRKVPERKELERKRQLTRKVQKK
jgi:hypothetical protein